MLNFESQSRVNFVRFIHLYSQFISHVWFPSWNTFFAINKKSLYKLLSCLFDIIRVTIVFMKMCFIRHYFSHTLSIINYSNNWAQSLKYFSWVPIIIIIYSTQTIRKVNYCEAMNRHIDFPEKTNKTNTYFPFIGKR